MKRSEQAFQQLLRLIRAGELPAGTTVTEQELVERLGVSRTPIREALTRLVQYGVVSRRPGASVVIQPLDLSRYVQLAEVRGVLEGYAARLFVRNATEADMVVVEQLAQAVDEANDAGNHEQEVAADMEFHNFIIKRCGNSELAHLLEVTNLVSTFMALPISPLQVVSAGRVTMRHRDLAAAFRHRDPDEAERAMRSHIGVYASYGQGD